MGKKFYITTPLYYSSGKWHLGHTYTTVLCDAIARFKRMEGCEVFYLTGTDEHGQKIADAAQKAGKPTQEYTDYLCENIKDLWQLLGISYDKFIRTTDDYHKKSVGMIFEKLLASGDIYKGSYSGKYCKPCEAFFSPSQLVDGNCPDCGRPASDFSEECYFFRLSKYADRIEKLLTQTDFLQPKFRVSEMVGSFIKGGLNDLAVSRTTVDWGIKVPSDPRHTVYVWIDALSNYINALGYNSDEKNMKYWAADVHMVGKEIVRFHAIVWPALLMALDLPLPKKVYGHGWLTLSGDKMSKSKGNAQDPFVMADKYGVDALRYYLLREIPMGNDAAFTLSGFLTRINTDLVNDLGNLVKRSIAMANQYFGGKVSKNGAKQEIALDSAYKNASAMIEIFDTPAALESIFATISSANKYIDLTTPWILFKEENLTRLEEVLYNLLETIRVCATLLLPFIPNGAERILTMLGAEIPTNFNDCKFGAIEQYLGLKEEILYQRIDIKKELEMEEQELKGARKDEVKSVEVVTNPFVQIEDFDKCELVCGLVKAAEKVEKADKLLKLSIDIDGQLRTIVSGIAQHYTPEEMVGKTVVVIKNLKPIKLRGIESHGMVLCATDGDNVVLIEPSKPVKSGSVVS